MHHIFWLILVLLSKVTWKCKINSSQTRTLLMNATTSWRACSKVRVNIMDDTIEDKEEKPGGAAVNAVDNGKGRQCCPKRAKVDRGSPAQAPFSAGITFANYPILGWANRFLTQSRSTLFIPVVASEN